MIAITEKAALAAGGKPFLPVNSNTLTIPHVANEGDTLCLTLSLSGNVDIYWPDGSISHGTSALFERQLEGVRHGFIKCVFDEGLSALDTLRLGPLINFDLGILAWLPALSTFSSLESNTFLTGSVAGIPANLTHFQVTSPNDVSGDYNSIDAVLGFFQLEGGHTTTGDIAVFSQASSLHIGGSNASPYGDVSNLGAQLVVLDIRCGNVTGNIGSIASTTYEFLRLRGNSRLSGDISGLASTCTHFDVRGVSDFGGDIATVSAIPFVYFNAAGANTLTGDLDMSGWQASYIFLGGFNTVSGTGWTSTLPSQCSYFYCAGNNELAGTPSGLSTKPSLAALTVFSTANTFGGAINGYHHALRTLIIRGQGVHTGSIADLPTAMQVCTLRDANTLSGSLNGLATSHSSLTQLHVEGFNTITGDVGLARNGMIKLHMEGNADLSSYSATLASSLTDIRLLGNTSLGSTDTEQLIEDIISQVLASHRSGLLNLSGSNSAPTSKARHIAELSFRGAGHVVGTAQPLSGGTGTALTIDVATVGSMGALLDFSLANAGMGYQTGDIVQLTAAQGDAQFEVKEVDGDGAVLSLSFRAGATGAGYQVGDLILVDGGAATLQVDAVSGDGAVTAASITVAGSGIHLPNAFSTNGAGLGFYATVYNPARYLASLGWLVITN